MATATMIDTTLNPSVSLSAEPTSSPTMSAKAPLYQIERFPLGFRVRRHDELLDLTIKLNEFTLEIWQTGDLDKSFPGPHKIYIYNYSKFLETCANDLAFQLQNKHSKTGKKVGLRKWFIKHTKGALSYALFPEWQHLLRQLPEEERNFLKLACSKLGPKFTVTPELIRSAKEYPFLWKDLHQYNSPWLVLSRLMTKQRVLNNEVNYNEQLQYDEDIGRCATPNDWRNAFAGNRGVYKALNKTLDMWPRGISWKQANALNEIKLAAPITERVKLVMLLPTISVCKYKTNTNAIDVVERSSPEQIRKAFRKFKKHYEKYVQKAKCPHISLRGCKTVVTFVNYIADYPHGHEGEIVGLTDKALAWHRDEEIRQEQEQVKRDAEKLATLTKPVQLPPVPLPEIDGIRFLESAADILAEGRKMKHCIASYVSYATAGERFLFHCDHEGESASVSILPTGEIEQCYGPRNSSNKASAYAERELKRWLRETRSQWVKPVYLPVGLVDVNDGLAF